MFNLSRLALPWLRPALYGVLMAGLVSSHVWAYLEGRRDIIAKFEQKSLDVFKEKSRLANERAQLAAERAALIEERSTKIVEDLNEEIDKAGDRTECALSDDELQHFESLRELQSPVPR